MQTTAAFALMHLNLDVRDLDVSERFYRDVLGMPIERREASLAIRQPGFFLVLARGEPKMGGSFHFGFRVATKPDVDAWFARLRDAGVPIVNEPASAGTVYVGRVCDPDGYGIEIYAEAAAG